MEEPKTLEDNCETLVDWLIGKVNRGEGLSCMAFVNCGKGAIVTIYQIGTVEESTALAREELETVFEDVTSYLIAFDGGWYDKSGVEHRAVIVDMEEKISLLRKRLAFVMQVSEKGKLSPTGQVLELEPVKWSLFGNPT